MNHAGSLALALIAAASPLRSSGLRLGDPNGSRPLHHIDYEKWRRDCPPDLRHLVDPPGTGAPHMYTDAHRGGPRKVCEGDVCRFHGGGAPLLFVTSKPDGLGARAQAVTAGMALAARHGMNFGGAVGLGEEDRGHGVDVVSMLSALYGTDVSADAPSDPVLFNTVPELEAFFRRGGAVHNASVYFGDIRVQSAIDTYISEGKSRMEDYYTPQFLSRIRQANTLPQHRGGRSKPVVALHVRRGDATMYPARITGDQFYFDMVRAIREHLPNAEVHVFTEGSPMRFYGYWQQGMHLHLDSGDVREAWEYFSSADVVVLAKSSFSHVPALLNPNCVIYQAFWHHPLDEWMIVDPSEATIHHDELRACLQRVRQ
mmetsp:Transcript_93424/g.264503  ORF Transcript_93424/g.264503 Transcript_93424/m.264503 type:complete len:371 (-) Transcript_93424:104-1216(-)